ncbi:urease accessory protein UreF [Sporobolomyces koalae]|uniref:urease accessory protein UreF n=1 Tax=Sporobolomyces koalae TaxID=500713 RepID=UPI00316FF7DA
MNESDPAPKQPDTCSTLRSALVPHVERDDPDEDMEEYLLLLLSDSNLPTGGFVASSGLESFTQHGYLSNHQHGHTNSSSSGSQSDAKGDVEQGLVEFVKMSLDNYSKLNGDIVKRAFDAVETFKSHSDQKGKAKEDPEQRALEELFRTDRLCQEMILNKVAKRASIAQGNALLSLYSRALAPSLSQPDQDLGLARLVEKIRSEVRKGTEGGWCGHQSTSFGIVMAAVNLSLHRSIHLFLFLHARSILSSAVRLNVVGPYSAHKLLLWQIRPLVQTATRETLDRLSSSNTTGMDLEEGDWWDNDEDWAFLKEGQGRTEEPVTTWPIGEIVVGRHDQLFTKVFNS